MKRLADEEYDAYNEWKLEEKKATIDQLNIRLAEANAKLIAEYKDYIRVFRDFHTLK